MTPRHRRLKPEYNLMIVLASVTDVPGPDTVVFAAPAETTKLPPATVLVIKRFPQYVN